MSGSPNSFCCVRIFAKRHGSDIKTDILQRDYSPSITSVFNKKHPDRPCDVVTEEIVERVREMILAERNLSANQQRPMKCYMEQF